MSADVASADADVVIVANLVAAVLLSSAFRHEPIPKIGTHGDLDRYLEWAVLMHRVLNGRARG